MERRSFLTGTILAFLPSITGCLDSVGQDDSLKTTDDTADSPADGTTEEPRPTDESADDSIPTERSDITHSVYVENLTDLAHCTFVQIEAADTVIDDSFRLNSGAVVEFADVLTGDSATIYVETEEYTHQIPWTSGDCPIEGSYYRSVVVQITANGIESAVDQCDMIVAGPFDDVTDETDTEPCDPPVTGADGK